MSGNRQTLLSGAVWLGLPLVLSGFALAFLARLLDIAPELSDNGYYILNTMMPQAIENQLSMFGLLWYSVFGPLPLIVSRALYLILLYASGAALGWTLAGSLAPAAPWGRRLAGAVCAGVAVLFIYLDARFDANYNGMVLIFFVAALICARPFLQPMTPGMLRFVGPFALWGIGFGASMMAVALTKVSSAALMTLWFLAVLIAAQWGVSAGRERWGNLGKLVACLIGWGLLGCVVLVGWLWLTVFSPTELAERFADGLHTTELMGGHSLTPLSVADQIWKLVRDLYFGFAALPLVSLTVLAPLGALLILRQRPELAAWCQVAVAGVVFLCGLLSYGVFLEDLSPRQFFETFGVLRVHAVALALLCLVCADPQPDRAAWILVATIIAGPILLTFGTNTAWIERNAGYSGLAFGLASVAIATRTGRGFRIFLPSALTIAALAVVGFLASIERHPYRLGGKLSTATVPVLFGPERTPMRAPDALAQSYIATQAFVPPLERLDPAPMLLDLSGRAPGMALHLGLRPPKVAWILSRYPGSADYFDYALAQLSAEDLSEAWVIAIDPKDGPYPSLPEGVLNQYLQGVGQVYPRDYERIAELPIAYIGRDAFLYRPARD